jgi:universal stress protein E
MLNFRNILFVSRGLEDETEALKQALSLARNNKAALKALIVCPDFPEEMGDYKDKFKAALIEQLKASIQASLAKIKINEVDLPVQIDVEGGDTPAIRIIRKVLRDAHDLVIKEAEPKESGKGFKAMDMGLLRKCPCPVWLTRPIKRHRKKMKVAVAIDPESSTLEGHDLSISLLQLANSLAVSCSGALDIVSCWNFEHENMIRGHTSAWFQISENELDELVANRQNEHRVALDGLIVQANLAGANQHIHHIKGLPEQCIPDFISQNGIDILVMGTVARTGIQSFIIGNTAENVVQKLSCSLLALKPNGFISPVKAY